MTNIKTLQAKAREQWAILVGPKSNQFDQNKALDTIIASTIKEFGEEIANEVERWHIKKGGYGNLAEHIRSLTETV